MRVAIESASLALSSGGLARYTGELALALARTNASDQIVLISDQPFRLPSGAPPNLRVGGGPRNALERRWWLWGISREVARLGADVIHGPDFAVPYLPLGPSVLTLHDLSPWLDPGWHCAAARVRRRTPLLLGLGLATMVVTPSEHVRRQALDRFRLRPERTVAVPEAAASWFHPVAAGPQRPYQNPYFLSVGTLEPRKNLPALVEAWRAVRRRHTVDLVLAGRPRADAPVLDPEPGLHLAGEVIDEKLPELYSGALALVYPSLYEGFGLPVLEAMQCGAAVIASRAVAETAGDAAIYAGTPSELAQAMLAVIERPAWAAEYRARALDRAAEFSWERTARATREVYQEAMRRFGQ